MDLREFRARFQPLFEGFLKDVCTRAGKTAQDGFIERMIHYPERLAGAEGKRIRPYVGWVMYGAQGPSASLRAGSEYGAQAEEEAVMKMLVALELFHVFALVHDDIIDHGTTRHGVPTAHVAIADLLRADHRTGDAARTGESQAILLGDLLFQWSQEAFFSTPGIDAASRERAAAYFRHMIEEVIIGQMMDVDVTFRPGATKEFINRKMHLKTSSYTFVRPMQIGAALGGASERVMTWCELFGAALGRAFQTQDDLLDLTVPAEGTGKTAFSDLHERQQTPFTLHIREHGTDAQNAELMSLLGADLSETDRPRITALFESSGAFAAGRAEIERSFAEADGLIASSPLAEGARQDLAILVRGMRERTS